MKKYFFAISAFTLCCFSFIAFSTYGQDVKIDGKNFLVTSKSQLNSGTEYFQLKEKSIQNAKNQGYIKTNGVFSKTVFSENEIKSFLTNGTISSLGKIVEKEMTVKIKTFKIKYIDKGTKKIFFIIQKGLVHFMEYAGSLNNLFVPEDDGSAGGETDAEKNARCHTGCWEIYMENCYDAGDGACFEVWQGCIKRCNDAFPINPHSGRYSIPTLNVKVKL